MRKAKFAFICICFTAMLTVVAWLLIREHLVASVGYTLVDTFTEMPADYSKLIEWVKRQPHVVEHTVYVDREDNRLFLNFLQVRRITEIRTHPGLDEQAAALGYKGGSGFRHAENSDRAEQE